MQNAVQQQSIQFAQPMPSLQSVPQTPSAPPSQLAMPPTLVTAYAPPTAKAAMATPVSNVAAVSAAPVNMATSMAPSYQAVPSYQQPVSPPYPTAPQASPTTVYGQVAPMQMAQQVPTATPVPLVQQAWEVPTVQQMPPANGMGCAQGLDGRGSAIHVTQCTCGNIFMDDSKFCRKCGADRKIVDALLVIERDESLFIEELNKIPGGREALASLRGVDPSGMPNGAEKRAAMQKIKESMDNAMKQAQQKAAQAKQRAAGLKSQAQDAKVIADKADRETKDNERQHAYLTDLLNHAKADEVKADREARRLKDLADQAAKEAADAHNAWLTADQHAHHHAGHAGQLTMKLEDAKRIAAARGLPTNPIDLELQVRTQQGDAGRKAQEAQRTRDLAAQAEERANKQLALASRVEQACQPGGGLETLLHVQQQANNSSRARGNAIHARKKADALAAQAQQIIREAEYAEQVARKAENDADEAEKQTNYLMQQSKAAQDALNLHVSNATGGGGESAPQVTPETARQAIQNAKVAADQARAEAIMYSNKAAQDEQVAQAAQQQASETMQIMDALPDVDGQEEEVGRARLIADRAKANADALAAAAAAAAKHAQACHQRAHKAADYLVNQQQRAAQLADKERGIWQKRFGDAPGGVGPCSAGTEGERPRGPPGSTGQFPTEAALEEASADRMLREAARAEDEAAKAEAQARRLAELMNALERARMFEEQLRPSVCECGNIFMEDSNFCRNCGRPRMQGWTWHGYDQSMANVRQQAEAAAADIEAHAAQAEATSPPREMNMAHTAPPQSTRSKVMEYVNEKVGLDGGASSNEAYSLNAALEPEPYFSIFR